jgi:hypothetical protein
VGPVAIANLWAVVTRGTRIPLLVERISRIALGLGVLVPMPTLSCAEVVRVPNNENMPTRAGIILLKEYKFFMNGVLSLKSK